MAGHFGFEAAFEAEGWFFLRNEHGFLLALVPGRSHTPLPDGFHIGFSLDSPDAVLDLHSRLPLENVTVGDIEDRRPAENYMTFRCWDPDATEIEVFGTPSEGIPATRRFSSRRTCFRGGTYGCRQRRAITRSDSSSVRRSVPWPSPRYHHSCFGSPAAAKSLSAWPGPKYQSLGS